MSHGDKAKVSVESQLVETHFTTLFLETLLLPTGTPCCLLGCSFLTLWLLKGPKAKLKHRI